MATKTAAKAATRTQTPAPEATFRPMPERQAGDRAASSARRIIEALIAGGIDVPPGEAVVVAELGSHKSALSTASRLRRSYAEVELVALGEAILGRPKTTAIEPARKATPARRAAAKPEAAK